MFKTTVFVAITLVGTVFAFYPKLPQLCSAYTVNIRSYSHGWELAAQPMDVNQVTLNRIRDCAVVNKENLKTAIQSTDMFTRSGKRRVQYLIGQLISSNPVASPSTSSLLGGTWVRTGSFPRRLKNIGVNNNGELTLISTQDSYFGGFVSVAQTWSPVNADERRYTMQKTSRRLRLGGLATITLPSRSKDITTEILYLDSDLHISRVCSTDYSEIYVKNLDIESNPQWTSPFRVRQRIDAAWRNFVEILLSRKQEVSQDQNEIASGVGATMIGSVDWGSEAPWQTEDNILEQADNVESEFSVQDLLEGRVKKRNGGNT